MGKVLFQTKFEIAQTFMLENKRSSNFDTLKKQKDNFVSDYMCVILIST